MNKGKAPCLGDSGDGFYVKDATTWTVKGIVSSSLLTQRHDCDTNVFSLYTNVAKFSDWITEMMETSV